MCEQCKGLDTRRCGNNYYAAERKEVRFGAATATWLAPLSPWNFAPHARPRFRGRVSQEVHSHMHRFMQQKDA